MRLKELWDMVNSIETIEQTDACMETVLAWSYKLSFDEFDELAMAISYIKREIRHGRWC